MRFKWPTVTGTRKYQLITLECSARQLGAVKAVLSAYDPLIGTVVLDQGKVRFSVDITDMKEDEATDKVAVIERAVREVLRRTSNRPSA